MASVLSGVFQLPEPVRILSCWLGRWMGNSLLLMSLSVRKAWGLSRYLTHRLARERWLHYEAAKKAFRYKPRGDVGFRCRGAKGLCSNT